MVEKQNVQQNQNKSLLIYKSMSSSCDFIPVEFLPGFWISLPQGIEGRGSGFLLAEHIRSVFSVNCNVPHSRKTGDQWTTLELKEEELEKEDYLEAFHTIIMESWLDTGNIILLGEKSSLVKILLRFLQKTGGINEEAAYFIISSKLK
jgi:hypothetical protein